VLIAIRFQPLISTFAAITAASCSGLSASETPIRS
jgi:hypothetical protein